MEEYCNELRKEIGEKELPIYFINTAKRKRGVAETIERYYECCRDNEIGSMLCPDTFGSVEQFVLPDVYVHAMYIRDKLIYDIYKEKKTFNWQTTSILIPPSIKVKMNQLLLELYLEKESLYKKLGPRFEEINEEHTNLIRLKAQEENRIVVLQNTRHLISSCQLDFRLKNILKGQTEHKINTSYSPDVIYYEICKRNMNITVQPAKDANGVAYLINFSRSKLCRNPNIAVNFYVEGGVYNKSEIDRSKSKVNDLQRRIEQLNEEISRNDNDSCRIDTITHSIAFFLKDSIPISELEEFSKLLKGKGRKNEEIK
eukprot:TRINITY_DN9655_c0_g1_i1.p1 TRINITY_DN9655_c0_g1~~TRINITY_DN9655_c0_g1_i1.p1  ORF type:complete len:314 (+),score=79.71 TRINITY_DN9655_c0_g1_i1:517-1458(+)